MSDEWEGATPAYTGKVSMIGTGHEDGFMFGMSFSATILPDGKRVDCFVDGQPVTPEEYARFLKQS